jgi:hypothetical protein
MVGYVLGLSNACPVKYGLLFERFTDPDRSEYPDIDIDLCQDGRGDVINYVRQKYGHVAQIITFGTLKARAAIRDVGRVLEMPLPRGGPARQADPRDAEHHARGGDRGGAGALTRASSLQRRPPLARATGRRTVLDNARILEGTRATRACTPRA